MSAILGYRGDSGAGGEGTESKITEILGLDSSDWNVGYRSTIKGKSQMLHFFDAVLESRTDGTLIPIAFIKSNEENISSKIMLHKVKSDDVASIKSYIFTDFPLKARDKLMCDMCHIKFFDIGSMINKKLLPQSLVDSFYGTAEHTEKSPPSESYDQKPKIFTRKNRDRTKIVQDVLENVLYMKSASITQLIYKCNLNYRTAKSLLNDMITKELLKIVEYSSIGKRYELTDKGRKMIERFQSYLNF